MQDYYDARLSEYDEVYLKPERQEDLKHLHGAVKRYVKDQVVFELACGTGYWTAIGSESAKRIFATDLSESAIAVAQRRRYACPVQFAVADALHLQETPAADVTMAMFWWSHVPKQNLEEFLLGLRAGGRARTSILFVDNRFVPESSTPISRTDSCGNTYQLRKLRDGSSHEVLKNFPTGAQISTALSLVGDSVEVTETHYYWVAKATLKA